MDVPILVNPDQLCRTWTFLKPIQGSSWSLCQIRNIWWRLLSQLAQELLQAKDAVNSIALIPGFCLPLITLLIPSTWYRMHAATRVIRKRFLLKGWSLPYTFIHGLGHNQNDVKGQEALETRVHRLRHTLQLGHQGVKQYIQWLLHNRPQ